MNKKAPSFADVIDKKSNSKINAFDVMMNDRIDIKKININNLIDNENNVYPISDIEELANSILQFGLMQPILVKLIDDSKNKLIIAGHRRVQAHKYLVEQGYSEFLEIEYNSIKSDEDDLITELKLHETNLQVRPLKDMSEEEKQALITRYLNLIERCRKENLMINGKQLKGIKTQQVLADMLGVGKTKASELMRDVKLGTENGTQEKKELSPVEIKEKEQNKLLKQFKKVLDNDYMDKEFHDKLVVLQREYNQRNKNKVDSNQTTIDDMLKE